MIFLAKRLLASKGQAYTVVILLMLISLFVKPAGILVGAAIAFICFSVNIQAGLVLAAVSSAVAIAANAIGQWIPNTHVVGTIALFIVPNLVAPALLKRTGSLAIALLPHVFASGLIILIMHLVLTDATIFWHATLTETNALINAQWTKTEINQIAGLMMSFIASLMAAFSISSFLMALHWSRKTSDLSLPNFQNLRYGRVAGIIMLIILGISLFQNTIAISLSGIIIVLCTFQSLALMHYFLQVKKYSKRWLIPFYFLLSIPNFLLFVALIGITDNWINFRKYLTEKA